MSAYRLTRDLLRYGPTGARQTVTASRLSHYGLLVTTQGPKYVDIFDLKSMELLFNSSSWTCMNTIGCNIWFFPRRSTVAFGLVYPTKFYTFFEERLNALDDTRIPALFHEAILREALG